VNRLSTIVAGIILVLASLAAAHEDEERLAQGYYRQPALHGNTIVFVAEGDLWRVDAGGGTAARLTTHAAAEAQPVISPDGVTIAFVGAYEGPNALYTMPLEGGRPVRRTWDSAQLHTVGWSPDGSLIFATNLFSTLPDMQLAELDTSTGELHRIPLAQADDGCYDDSSEHLFFTRYPFQGSSTKRYVGGTAQRLWRFSQDAEEAVPLTADYRGTSRDPMWWQGRLYFASDRDGTMNLWSMLPDGGDLMQHTHHVGWDLLSPSLSEGRVVYQLGADIRLLDLTSSSDEIVPISLISDFDQTREHWVEKPIDYLTSAHISPDGDRVVLTARGQVFVAPHRKGRLVSVPCKDGVRHRDARFLSDGERLLSMSDGEAFLEAIRRLQLGPIIGIRTWGGGIWLNASNFLVDRGIATAAEYGLFGPEGRWIIEMDGVDPDQVVDNLPHATFNGADAQLDAAIELLKQKIAKQPVQPLQEPPGKDLSLRK
jgi:tricorn protease